MACPFSHWTNGSTATTWWVSSVGASRRIQLLWCFKALHRPARGACSLSTPPPTQISCCLPALPWPASSLTGTPATALPLHRACLQKYQNVRPAYIDAFFSVINWRGVSEAYAMAVDGKYGKLDVLKPAANWS